MICGGFILLLSGCSGEPKVPSLKETYEMTDRHPFGGYLLYHELQKGYDNVIPLYSGIEDIYGGNEEIWDEEWDGEDPSSGDSTSAGEEENETGPVGRELYMIVADRFSAPDSEMDDLLNYVREGNDVFISANEFPRHLMKEAGVNVHQLNMSYNLMIKLEKDYWGKMSDTRVNIYFGEGLPKVPFSYFYYNFSNYFRDFDSSETKVLGTNNSDQANFIVVFLDKGKLFLHHAPRALGNYFLLTRNNLDYLHHIMNYLPEKPMVVYWDEYYKKRDAQSPLKSPDDNFSSLGVIMQSPFLKWAILIAAAGLLVYILSNMRRKQRIIPLAPKTDNASVDFVETVARLYYVNKNNKNIADKLITYFNEYVRSRFFIHNTNPDEAFAIRLAGKKGMSVQDTTELINCIRSIREKEELTDGQLLKLNQLLENFYNHK